MSYCAAPKASHGFSHPKGVSNSHYPLVGLSSGELEKLTPPIGHNLLSGLRVLSGLCQFCTQFIE